MNYKFLNNFIDGQFLLLKICFLNVFLGRSNSPCPLEGVDVRSENSKWRIRRKEEKSKEISVDDLINNFPSVWQMQGIDIDFRPSTAI